MEIKWNKKKNYKFIKIFKIILEFIKRSLRKSMVFNFQIYLILYGLQIYLVLGIYGINSPINN